MNDEALKCLNFLKNTSISDIAALKDSSITKTLNDVYFNAFDTIEEAIKPKKYLKWDDLRFEYDMKNIKVKMGNNEYIIRYFLNALDDYECFLCDVERNQLIRLYKHFFNDLKLEVIENE